MSIAISAGVGLEQQASPCEVALLIKRFADQLVPVAVWEARDDAHALALRLQ